jgi:PKD domain-containing protein
MRSRRILWATLATATAVSLGAMVGIPGHPRASAKGKAAPSAAVARREKASPGPASPSTSGQSAARALASAPGVASSRSARKTSSGGPVVAPGPEASRPELRVVEAARDVEEACEVAGGERDHPRLARLRSDLERTSRTGAKLENEADHEIDRYADWFYGQRSYPAKRIPGGALQDGLNHARSFNGGLHGGPGEPAAPGPAPQATWVAIGPSTLPNGQTDTGAGAVLSPVSGRVSAIAVHPTNHNIVYAAGAQGGVWKSTDALSATPTWIPLTDHQPSLAVGSIAIDPVNPNIVYVGTGEPNGSCDSYYGAGILRSTDGGNTWTVLGGAPGGPFAGQSISKILIDPVTAGSSTGTTLWASTALGFLSSGTEQCALALGVWNGAVWRSTDSGATWSLQDVPTGAALPNAQIHDMVLDPTNPNILYVAVRSRPVAANGGVWKSTNAKGAPATFTKLTGGFANTVTANPGIRRITLGIGGGGAPGTLYAAMEVATSSALWGLYKSTDGGATWAHLDNGRNGTCNVTTGSRVVTRVTGPTFTNALIGQRIIVNNQFTRTVAAVADGDHLSVSNGESAFNATLAGTSWSVAAYPSYCDGQCFYDMTIGVDPADATASTVYVGGNPEFFNFDLASCGSPPCFHTNWRSDDGGATWTSISQGNGTTGGIHTDDHAIAFDTSVTPSRMYDGNDGGIWRTDDKGASWVSMNTNIAITQFQSVGLHPSDPNILIGGTQDNGTNIHNPALEPPPAWFHSDFGDGGQSFIDQSTPLRMFHTYFNSSFFLMGPAKTINGGVGGPGTWDFVGTYYGYGSQYYNGMDPTDPVSFYAPLAQHPAFTPNVVYFGSDKVYRSADPVSPLLKVDSWTAVSPSLSTVYLSAIGVFPNLLSGKELLYTGGADGQIQVSSGVDATATATWTRIDNVAGSPLPVRFVTQILVPGSDATGNIAYAAFSGFNANTPLKPGHLFRTTNGLSGGAVVWTDLSGDLPDLPVNAVAIEPGTPDGIYVGTDIGVFRTLDDGVHWSYLSEGFPVVSVFGLERNAGTGQLVASTHGRGMFQLNAGDVTPPVCGGSATGANQFSGSAFDSAPGDTGIASVALQAGSSNLSVPSVTYVDPTSVTFVVNTLNHCLPGSGTVVVSDYNGNTCTVPVALSGDPVPLATIDTPVFVCSHSTANTASVPDAGPGATYTWTITNGTILSGNGTPSVTYGVTTADPVFVGVTVTNAAGCSATNSATVGVNAACGNFFTLAPCRVVNTRFADAPPLAAGSGRTFFVTGGTCGIPSSAHSISVNVTVTQPAAGGDLKVFAGGTLPPTTSVINYSAGQTRANNAIVQLGPGGTISVQCDQPSGTVEFILDVNGYFE